MNKGVLLEFLGGLYELTRYTYELILLSLYNLGNTCLKSLASARSETYTFVIFNWSLMVKNV